MQNKETLNYIKEALNNMPSDWLKLTTHRLDIYNEKLAKTQFLEQFESLVKANNCEESALSNLPTAYDYIRLGHPLSCVLEWTIAKLNKLNAENVISFSSQTTPLLAILRKNLFENKNTQIFYTDKLPNCFDTKLIQKIYNYNFEVVKIETIEDISAFEGTSILFTNQTDISKVENNSNIDFYINIQDELGSVLVINGKENDSYISEIQHVRRRETIAMTPINCQKALQLIVGNEIERVDSNRSENKEFVLKTIQKITGSPTQAVAGSSGLSIQYAIMMGLIHDANENYPNKDIKFIVPTNCYGGTNDQARRVAACIDNVEVVDLHVDGDNDMVSSLETILTEVANQDAVPYIIAEIGCNHKGDMEIAKELIKVAKIFCNVDAVKFQKRHNKELLTEDQYNQPHPNPINSYGDTYGAHREFLEFDVNQHEELKSYCEEIGITYSTSVWDLTSAKEITTLNPEFIKIPSACNNNVEMLEWLCDNYKGELHISTGMTTKSEIEELVSLFKRKNRNKDLVLYNCTSGYPVPFDDVCLLDINKLNEAYRNDVKHIGFSGHHLGIAVDVAAFTLGANIIERHYTIDRTWKGTDHAASLEPMGLRKLSRDVNAVYKALQFKNQDILPIEQVQRDKLKNQKG